MSVSKVGLVGDTGRMPAPHRRPSPSGPRTFFAILTGITLVLTLTIAIPSAAQAAQAAAACTGNEIACENQLAGTPASVWDDIGTGAGDGSIQGFATQMSVNKGDTVHFKIDTDASAYRIEIYRLGYYQGNGARKMDEFLPSATLPQIQPACATDPATEIYDCGTWQESASWAVPSTAVSGVYLAKLVRTDNGGGASHIPFIVRNDGSSSAVVYQTSDPTWQAYNTYGGSNFYWGMANGRAYKLSYNRPFATRGLEQGRDFLFSNEYPMIRFLERNGYDVSYISGLDTDVRGDQLTNHKAFLSVGHDEYWSENQRKNVERARDAGVNLAFFSGNEVYWKTRWESSEDGTNTPNRTLVCYKDTWANSQIDPVEPTATWRDPRFGDNGHGPENALTGTAYMSNDSDLPLTVTGEEGSLRIWRNTGLNQPANGVSTQLAPHTVGYESDEDVDNGYRPAGLVRVSTTTGAVPQYLQDFGNTVAPGTTTHHATMYRAASGALVFGAGTIQWAWGLDTYHDGTVAPVDTRMQQATVNILADMDAVATTLSSPGVVAATKSNDSAAPTATITGPAQGTFGQGSSVTVTGTASDAGGGVVAGVEVSLDGGGTWHPASGRSSFSYTGLVSGTGSSVIRARAIDDSGNIQPTPAVLGGTVDCPCSIFGDSIPKGQDSGDGGSMTLGVKFQASVDGFITGVRFYKSIANTGTHTGTLYTADGTSLSSVAFTNESAQGWQTATFATAVPITAGTTYVAAYNAPNGHYSADSNYFAYRGATGGPLTALGGYNQPNGFYAFGSRFPDSSYKQTNYYVDAVYSAVDTTPMSVVSHTPVSGASSVATDGTLDAVFSRDPIAASIAWTVTGPGNQTVTGTASYDSNSRRATFAPSANLAFDTTYSVSLTASAPGIGVMPTPVTWSFKTAREDQTGGSCPCGLFNDSDIPAVLTADDPNSVELGVSFNADTTGQLSGIRFYKGINNAGPHTVNLWDAAGQLLASAQVQQGSTTGWQTAMFASPVPVTAGVTYVASYRAPAGRYSYSANGLLAPIDRTPLHTPERAGRYTYGSGAPLNSSSSNYFVDPIFTVDSNNTPIVSSVTPVDQATSVPLSSSINVTFSTTIQAGTASITLKDPFGATVPGQLSNQLAGSTARFVPNAPLDSGATYTVTVTGARNLGGVPMAAGFTSTFTTAGVNACPCSVMSTAAIPAVSNSGETAALTLGMRFSSDVDGFVTGLRYFRDAANIGVHTGTLFSAAGQALGTLTFSDGEPGWQTAYFTNAIPITAGTIYVASTFMPNGHYSYTTGFFDAPYVNSPLTGLMGLYVYGADDFPTSSYNNGNYFVDATFTTQDPATATTPAAPANVTATAGNGSARVSWAVPSNGGAPITGYTVTPYEGTTALTPVTVSGSNPATTAVVGSLTNGTAYTFTVTATNAKGTSSPSGPSAPVTPAPTLPGAPSGVSGTAGDGQVTVAWTAPVSDGGSAITGYTVTPFIGTQAQPTTAATGTSAVVGGLTNGTAYTFTVTATNAVGVGPASAASAAVTPAGLPVAPTGVTATGGNGTASVTWTAPTTTGGIPLTGYVVTPFIGGTAQTPVTVTGTPPATSTTITGLTNGTAYTFTVAAANAVGQGAASTASAPVTPATVPDAPTAVTAVAGSGQATVSWTAPAANGGSAITGYTVTPYAGTTAGTPTVITGTGTSTTVTGLTNGTSYTFVVSATNAVGTGPPSVASAAVTPVAPTVPGAPTNVTGTPGNTQVMLTWTAPADGGAQITRYTVTPYIGTTAQTTRIVQVNGTPAATTATVTGLNNGTAYTFRVTATNSVGTSATYGVSGPITPATTPGAPTIGTTTAGDTSVTVRWTAPTSTGGSPITGYQVTPYIGTAAQAPVSVAGTATSTVVSGMTNGTAYTFRVAAVNVMGTGAQSAASAATTPFGVPGAPTGAAAVAGNQSLYLTWSAPASNGGSAITGYTVTRFANGVSQGTTSAGANTNLTVNSLTNGTTYTFTVTATNARGTSAASTASAGVKPLALFVQGTATRATGTTTVTATPTSNLTAGNRLIAMVGVEGTSTTTAQSVTDAAGNTYTKVTSTRAPDNTEMSIWTAPITAGAGTRPVVTARSSASATMAITVTEYAGLSTAAGTGAVDVFKTATGSASSSGTAQSGATTGTTGVGEVAIGFYLDGGPSRSVTTPSGYTARVSGVNNSTMEYLIADQTIWPSGTTANAQFGISQFLTIMPWAAGTVVFKRG
jgi:hypothetical protein